MKLGDLRAPLLALLIPLTTHAAIDREALVRRHSPSYSSWEDLHYTPKAGPGSIHETGVNSKFTPLQVGNGEFAFSVDATGLQTFIPCNTLSHWGWHRQALPEGRSTAEFPWTEFDSDHGKKIPFPWVGLANDAAYKGSQISLTQAQREMAEYLRANPHRLNLGRLGFLLRKTDGSLVEAKDIQGISQTLDLWEGAIHSRFLVEGTEVQVTTLCHPSRDLIAVRVNSALIEQGRLEITLRFPYGDSRGYTPDVGDWKSEASHKSEIIDISEEASNASKAAKKARILRSLDATRYTVSLQLGGGASAGARLEQGGAHEFKLRPGSGKDLELLCEFAPLKQGRPSVEELRTDSFAAIEAENRAHWAAFWKQGAAVDFSGSSDPRAKELERRVVLSQYLLAIQEAGSLPPQEAGLVNNGWYGKFHLEMYWWHAAHYALWNRWNLLNRSLPYYSTILPQAKALARRQGFAGARWPKMTDPEGSQSPSSIAPFLIWQQPHPIFFAELDYRHAPTRETLERWKDIVFETANFMAALPAKEATGQRLILGAPLKTVPENTRAESTRNPCFELSYWRFGLRIAQAWRQRLGMGEDPRWAEVLEKLAPLPSKDGRYLLSESQPDSYENYPWEHPSLIGPLGMLPGDGVDRKTMERTLDAVLSTWKMDRVWGWDFPLLAMSAARLGRPEQAIDLLLTDSPNFQFAPNGFATGGPWPYFPSNGGLLYAIGLMAGGWDGPGGDAPSPGFPKGKGWKVQAEGFSKAP